MNWTSNPRPRYISGSISNGGTKEPSFEGFNEAEKRLREEGFEVLNPARWEQEEIRTWEWYLARDLKLIYDKKPVLYMLRGWEVSQGARLEKEWSWYLARDLKVILDRKPVMYMLKGWELSQGARLEKAWAELLKLDVEYEQLD